MILDDLQKEISEIIDRSFDRTLRIAVTGLSRSGKTAFITSMINQLLFLNKTQYHHLPLFDVARRQGIIGVMRLPQQDLEVSRFEYEDNLQSLLQQPPIWCQSTRGVSETRLAIRYQRHSGLLRHFKEQSTLYLDIFDYPGEWLLDLPLLHLDFQQWSAQQQEIHHGVRQTLSTDWLQQLKQLDLLASCNEDILAKIAKTYTQYLLNCKQQGMQFIQPGRFVLPGELEGAPVLQFFPLIHLSPEQWQHLTKEAKADSYFSVLCQRYQFYQKNIVKKFYQDYFSTFDRQVILMDCLTPLNHSQQAFLEMKIGLNQLMHNFHYGSRNILNRLFSPQIDKLMFVVTKVDHITMDQIPHLISLMRQLIQEGGRHAEFEGVSTEYTAISAIRSTKQVLVNQNGKQVKAIQGVRSKDRKLIMLYPGNVPSKLPPADFWQQNQFEFDQFEPLQAQDNQPIAHLRMDTVLQFLLGDRFD